MIKKSDNKQKVTPNVTKERLSGTPFETAADLNAAQQDILKETWERLERARATKELLKKEEYQFFTDIFQKGLLCSFGENKGSLVRVFLAGDGIQVAIDEKLKTAESSEALVGVLIQSMSSSFMTSYLKAMGMLPTDIASETSEATANLKSKKKKS